VGPWCPIYGFGAVFISLLLSRHAEDPLAVFGLAILICGILEYSASYMLEKIFHARWWDYSTKKFNLNGRVCADVNGKYFSRKNGNLFSRISGK